ncbi:hypothetical protein [Arenimonas sp. MALMAid1274]|uniref:hypothetical protein n=1 Tax=Arenimonas sp. MALMAid1274 TaxID=3411630 RepID=UPI003BA0968B
MVPLLLLGGFQLLRWHAMGPAQREALRWMQPLPPREGENAFKWLALANYQVSPGQVDAAMAEEISHFQDWNRRMELAAVSTRRPDFRPYPFAAKEKYGARPPPAYGALECMRDVNASCLDTVRGKVGPVRALLEQEAGRLEMMDRALSADHLSNLFPRSAPVDSLQFNGMGLVTLRAALAGADGRVGESLELACRQMATLRRFRADTDVATAHFGLTVNIQRAGKLVLDLRRAHPAQPLPPACTEALRPVEAEDYILCNAMRDRNALFEHYYQLAARMYPSKPRIDRWLHEWFGIYEPLRKAWHAQQFSAYCGQAAVDDMEAGRTPANRDLITPGQLACYAAPASCHEQSRRQIPEQEALRALDAYASLRLLLAAHRLAEGGQTPHEAWLALRLPGYPVAEDADGKRWSIAQRALDGQQFEVDISGLGDTANAGASR